MTKPKKKSLIERMDEGLYSDIEQIDQALLDSLKELQQSIQKKWGHPIIYSDFRHVRHREQMREIRKNDKT